MKKKKNFKNKKFKNKPGKNSGRVTSLVKLMKS